MVRGDRHVPRPFSSFLIASRWFATIQSAGMQKMDQAPVMAAGGGR
jgi:hypothetical protein